MTKKLEQNMEGQPVMAGNFPVDQWKIDALDLGTGELLFEKRISNSDRYLDDHGRELVDPRPHSPALGKKPEANIRDYIRTLVHSERLQQELDAQGFDTFEEANDFEVGDDYFPDSAYENDLEPSVAELVREGTASLSAKARAEEARQAKIKASERENRSQGDTPPHSPEKSPRRARKGPAAEPEGSANGDHSQSDED